jgi:uncharacterized protein (TIGR00290 family)
MKANVIISWSSGKDSALTLSRLLKKKDCKIVALMTTHVKSRVPFQETPMNVVRAQAKQLSLPLLEIELPEVFPENSVYQSLIVNHLNQFPLPVDAVAFGDIHCNGIAEYRRSYLEPAGYQCLFPLMGEDPNQLALSIFQSAIETKMITIDSEQLDCDFIGQDYTPELVRKLPENVDPCGENGEFHTLVTNMPEFKQPLRLEFGDIANNGRFYFQTYQLAKSSIKT